MIKFCKNDDGKIAIGTGIRPIEYCRECHIQAHSGEFVEASVVINHRDLGIDPEALAIACAKTGEDISTGTVWLDPVETNIAALVYAGYIEVIQPKAKADKVTRTTEA